MISVAAAIDWWTLSKTINIGQTILQLWDNNIYLVLLCFSGYFQWSASPEFYEFPGAPGVFNVSFSQFFSNLHGVLILRRDLEIRRSPVYVYLFYIMFIYMYIRIYIYLGIWYMYIAVLHLEHSYPGRVPHPALGRCLRYIYIYIDIPGRLTPTPNAPDRASSTCLISIGVI